MLVPGTDMRTGESFESRPQACGESPTRAQEESLPPFRPHSALCRAGSVPVGLCGRGVSSS